MGKPTNNVNNYTDFFYHIFRNILLFSFPFTIISALVLSLPHSSADSSSDTVKLSVPVSCTLASHINTGEEHTISMISGTYEDNIGITTLTTYCNDPGGFVIYANGNTNNIEGNNKLTSILGSTYDIPSGTATSGDTSQWAMKLTAVSSSTPSDTPTIATGYDNYSTVPSQWTKVVYKDAGTVNVETGSSFTTTYAIYLKGLQPAGTYSGQVKYVMLHPSTTGAPASTINEAFANANKTPVSVLDPETGQIGSFYKMQDMNTGICESVAGSNESTTARLVDIRDNKLYYVTKLDDGHCWMTQNLDLDLGIKDTTLGIDTTVLTSNDTDLNDNSLSGAYKEGYNYDPNSRVISWGPKNATINFSGTSILGWGISDNTIYSANKTDSIETGHSSLGNYYNWPAAIASNNCDVFDDDTYNDITKNPQNSICPKGWRLPTISNIAYTTAGSTSEFGRLNYIYNNGDTGSNIGLISSPLWFTQSGHIYKNTVNQYNTYGSYWSSTVHSKSIANYLNLSDSSVNPNSFFGNGDVYCNAYDLKCKSAGLSLRCLAR